MYLTQEREDASGVDCVGCDVACIARKGTAAIVMGATTVDLVLVRLLLLLLLLLLLWSCRVQYCAARSRRRLKRLHGLPHVAPGCGAELDIFTLLCAALR